MSDPAPAVAFWIFVLEPMRTRSCPAGVSRVSVSPETEFTVAWMPRLPWPPPNRKPPPAPLPLLPWPPAPGAACRLPPWPRPRRRTPPRSPRTELRSPVGSLPALDSWVACAQRGRALRRGLATQREAGPEPDDQRDHRREGERAPAATRLATVVGWHLPLDRRWRRPLGRRWRRPLGRRWRSRALPWRLLGWPRWGGRPAPGAGIQRRAGPPAARGSKTRAAACCRSLRAPIGGGAGIRGGAGDSGSDRHEAAAGEHQAALRAGCHVGVMGDHQQGSAGGMQAAEEVQDLGARGRVGAAGGLVGPQRAR
jgi:hypothetical protein